MARPLLVATTNRDKIAEIRQILDGLPYQIQTLDGMPGVTPPAETGRTFQENARIKALAYADASGLLTVAEDSGLEVDALDGAPGVHSARYGEPQAVLYPDKFALMYRQLRDRGFTTSPARFVCAVALAEPGRIVFETTGRIEGELAPAPRGTHGFGYDPIFFYAPYGRTLAEVTREEKAHVSHRGQAFRQLRDYLSQTSEGSAAGGRGSWPPGKRGE